MPHLVADFVKVARYAYKVKPHAIELNISCPNVYGKEGSLHKDPDTVGQICRKVAKELPEARILLKIGHLPEDTLTRHPQFAQPHRRRARASGNGCSD